MISKISSAMLMLLSSNEIEARGKVRENISREHYLRKHISRKNGNRAMLSQRYHQSSKSKPHSAPRPD